MKLSFTVQHFSTESYPLLLKSIIQSLFANCIFPHCLTNKEISNLFFFFIYSVISQQKSSPSTYHSQISKHLATVVSSKLAIKVEETAAAKWIAKIEYVQNHYKSIVVKKNYRKYCVLLLSDNINEMREKGKRGREGDIKRHSGNENNICAWEKKNKTKTYCSLIST